MNPSLLQAAPAGVAANPIVQMVPYLLMFVIFYFVLLAPMRKQLAVARGLVIRAIALRVRLDGAPDEPQLSPALLRERLAQRDLAGTQRLDLGTRERDAGLEALENVKLVPRLAVARDRAFALGHRRSLGRSPECA